MRKYHRPGRGRSRRARRRLAGGSGRLRVVPPRGAEDHARPQRGQHGRLRVHRAGRAAQPHRRGELDPAGGPGGRPVLRQARSSGSLLREGRQHRRRARGRGLSLEVQERVPQPELVPGRGADGRLGRRPGHQLPPAVRPLQGDVQERASREDARSWRTTSPSRRPTRARRRSRTTPRCRRARSSRCRAAARRSSARATIRSSSTSAPCSTASTSTSRAGPTSASATRAAARTTWRRTTRTRSSCRCRSPRSRATARTSPT